MDEMTVVEFGASVEKLSAVAVALEAAVQRLVEKQDSVSASAEESIGRIVATAESAREAELERKLAEAEQVIAELKASAAASSAAAGRKTRVAATVMAKGLGDLGSGGVNDLAAVDAALTSLSVEQRIAVKAEMLRAGLLR